MRRNVKHDNQCPRTVGERFERTFLIVAPGGELTADVMCVGRAAVDPRKAQ
jgi:hypothetical protein